jgi:hypothetical protein
MQLERRAGSRDLDIKNGDGAPCAAELRAEIKHGAGGMLAEGEKRERRGRARHGKIFALCTPPLRS